MAVPQSISAASSTAGEPPLCDQLPISRTLHREDSDGHLPSAHSCWQSHNAAACGKKAQDKHDAMKRLPSCPTCPSTTMRLSRPDVEHWKTKLCSGQTLQETAQPEQKKKKLFLSGFGDTGKPNYGLEFLKAFHDFAGRGDFKARDDSKAWDDLKTWGHSKACLDTPDAKAAKRSSERHALALSPYLEKSSSGILSNRNLDEIPPDHHGSPRLATRCNDTFVRWHRKLQGIDMLHAQHQAVSPSEEYIKHNDTLNRLVKEQPRSSDVVVGHHDRGVWSARYQDFHKPACEPARTERASQVGTVLGEDTSDGRNLPEKRLLDTVSDNSDSIVLTMLGELSSATEEHQNQRGAKTLDRHQHYLWMKAGRDAARHVVACWAQLQDSGKFFTGKELETYGDDDDGDSLLRWKYSDWYLSTTRILTKIGVLSISPACIHVLSNYAISRQLSSPASAMWFYPWLSDTVQVSASTVNP